MKRVLLDSSSAILLFKTDLLDALVAEYQVSITPSVKHELTSENRAGAERILHLIHVEKIRLTGHQNTSFIKSTSSSSSSSLDRGERDTIRCFEAGRYDFIITDDGKAAKYCSLNDIPFINALLLPRVLYFMNNFTLQPGY